ncbi:hypothetical protein OIO90_001246 [Microbotryomycetes sp. JL221]|nr:hypothetical protein OIO90_001246 [Microbotryomycetes sp. JL221]
MAVTNTSTATTASSSAPVALPSPNQAPAAAAINSRSPGYVISWTRNNPLPHIPLPPMSAFVAGGLAGAASRTVVSPLERLKIIMQVQGPNAQYNGILPSLAKMWKEEGFKGYMRGNGINCLRIAPYSAVQFSTYELIKSVFVAWGHEIDTPRRLLAGSLAGIASVVSTYPLDLVRSRLSIESASLGLAGTNQKRNTGIMKMTARVYKQEGGISGLYRGLTPTALGVAPYVGINFAAYEFFRALMSPDPEHPPGTLAKLACGAAAGSISQTLTYPLDVLRRKMQVASMPGMDHKYTTTWGAIKYTIKTESLRGLYKGLTSNLLKVGPSIATQFALATTPSSSSSGPLFGSLPKATGFLRRGQPKKVSANTSPKLPLVELRSDAGSNGGAGQPSAEADNKQPHSVDEEPDVLANRNKIEQWSFKQVKSEAEGLGFDYGRRGSLNSKTSTSRASSMTDGPSDIDLMRRGSAVSASSMSQSPAGGGHSSYAYGGAHHRHSISSLASSAGSPLASASFFSTGGTTIGDLSTSSMPLLQQGQNGSGSGAQHQTSSTYRMHLDASSTASASDTSSIYSYQFPTATGTRSRAATTSSVKPNVEAMLDIWKAWVRDQQSSNAAPADRVRSRSGNDGPPESKMYRVSSRSTTSSNGGHNRTLPHSNPLYPLRKRLVRYFATGKRLGVEFQMLLELLDALEMYIKLAIAHQGASPTANASSSSPSLSSSPTDPSPTVSIQNLVEQLSEIRSLVRELVECVPDVQACLTAGMYGPLAFPTVSTSPINFVKQPPPSSQSTLHLPMISSTTTASMVAVDLRDSQSNDWWPKRMAHDCRGLLDDVGYSISTLTPSTPRLSLVLETSAGSPGSGGGVGGGGGGGGGGSGTGSVTDQGNGAIEGRSIGGTGTINTHITAAAADELASSSLEEALGALKVGGGGTVAGLDALLMLERGLDSSQSNGTNAIKRDSKRKEQLLVEGQKRWDAYRKRQASLAEHGR